MVELRLHAPNSTCLLSVRSPGGQESSKAANFQVTDTKKVRGGSYSTQINRIGSICKIKLIGLTGPKYQEPVCAITLPFCLYGRFDD